MAGASMDLDAIAGRTPRRVDAAADPAAVLVPVVRPTGTSPAVLFTKRADHLGEHPGQMSFPGGGREDRDADLLATALREADEEIGLTAAEVSVRGPLDDIVTVTDYAVSPFVGTVPDRPYQPDEREVAEVVPLPVAGLLDPANYEVEVRDHPRVGSVTVHYFHVDGYTVWGATARILAQLLELTTDWRPPVEPESGSEG